MQNDPPFKSEPGEAQPATEHGQDDLTLKQEDSTLLAPSHATISPETIESTSSTVSPSAPVASGAEQSVSSVPLVQPAVSPPQAQPVPPAPSGIQATPATQGAQAGAVPVTPQPVIPPGYVISQGYIVPQGYTVSQGYVVPQGYIVSQGYVVPQSYVTQPGYVPTTPQPGLPPGYGQPGYVPPQQTLPPGYLPPHLAPQPPRPRLTRDKSSLLMIGGVILVVVILLGVIFGALVHPGGNSSVTSTSSVPTISTTPNSSLGHPTSAFQATGCPFEADPALLQSKQLSCGYVTVPENRSVKNNKKVKLAVAIFKPQQYIDTADPAPVIRLDGGPGGPSLSGWAQYINSTNIRTFIFDHDVVMFDQRGTGYSTPSLNCTESASLRGSSAQSGITSYEQAMRACYNRLTSQGIDLNGFNSLQNAADVADIIHALGYQQMTLYGVSYGTRLALTTMRLYPSVVRATVLDSVYPPNHNRAELTSDAQRVFGVLFQGCTQDANCNAKYPNLQTVFYSLVDQLNTTPISFYTVDSTTNQQYTITFDGDDLVSWAFSVLYATSLIPAIPEIIYQIKAHNYFLLSYTYSLVGFDDTISEGLFYSAECSEDWPFLTAQSVTQSEQGIEPHLAKVFGQEDEQQEYDICQFWKVNKVPDAQKQPVVSSIPTLITTGEYDPITPPTSGQDAAKTLSHSYFFEFPGQGHGQLYSSFCSSQIISAFENNPAVKPDGSCISLMHEPQFL